ncbi:hypothetical protein FH972_018727 [Carpinus fangiana]|uniref:Uncharacterized protein n=1 Tax=Carpinus fangiana TaxID=176857 RepID=A0A5N6RNE4_9ROSI|nr:hypothetical protein FH972_018727 [Carpinus fangiana]
MNVLCTDGKYQPSDEDFEALQSLQSDFQKCMSANGLGLQAAGSKDYCEVTINFPSNTVPKWVGASFGSAEKGTGLKALEFALSICESVDMYGFTVDPGYKEWHSHVAFEARSRTWGTLYSASKLIHTELTTDLQMAIGGQEYGCFSSNFGGVQPKVCVRDGEETGKNHILIPEIRTENLRKNAGLSASDSSGCGILLFKVPNPAQKIQAEC